MKCIPLARNQITAAGTLPVASVFLFFYQVMEVAEPVPEFAELVIGQLFLVPTFVELPLEFTELVPEFVELVTGQLFLVPTFVKLPPELSEPVPEFAELAIYCFKQACHHLFSVVRLAHSYRT